MLRSGVIAVLTVALFYTAVNGDMCNSYYDSTGTYHYSQLCMNATANGTYCCGNCQNRYCCNSSSMSLNQNSCSSALVETCDAYINVFGYYYPSQSCGAGQYCCGACNNRYCCTSSASRLPQNTCSSSVGETCNSYIDVFGNYYASQQCDAGQYCCGTCQNRYCSTSLASRLLQTTCSTTTSETCNAYTSTSGLYYPLQQCSSTQYCCGTCNNRYCCSSYSSRLTQNTCSSTTGETCNAYTSTSGLYYASQQCSSGQYCCGTCNYRYCCSSSVSRLPQNTCSSTTGETCNAYTSTSGLYYSSQQCSSGQYCCGSCNSRYCCSSYSSRLWQNTCSSTNTQNCNSYTDSFGSYNPSQSCSGGQFCCGTCNYRYCCSSYSSKLYQSDCDYFSTIGLGGIFGIVAGAFIFIAVVSVTACFFCACCCFQGRRRTTHFMPTVTNGFAGSTTTMVTFPQTVAYPPNQVYVVGQAPPPYSYAKQ